MRNAELFEKIAATIEEYPDRYDQSNWGKSISEDIVGNFDICDTAYCIAGWAVTIEGVAKLVGLNDFVWADDEETRFGADTIATKARELLGIDSSEADILFHEHWLYGRSSEVPEELRRIAAGARIVSQPEWRDL